MFDVVCLSRFNVTAVFCTVAVCEEWSGECGFVDRSVLHGSPCEASFSQSDCKHVPFCITRISVEEEREEQTHGSVFPSSEATAAATGEQMRARWTGWASHTHTHTHTPHTETHTHTHTHTHTPHTHNTHTETHPITYTHHTPHPHHHNHTHTHTTDRHHNTHTPSHTHTHTTHTHTHTHTLSHHADTHMLTAHAPWWSHDSLTSLSAPAFVLLRVWDALLSDTLSSSLSPSVCVCVCVCVCVFVSAGAGSVIIDASVLEQLKYIFFCIITHYFPM